MAENTKPENDKLIKDLITQVITEDFPFIDIAQIAGYVVDESSITGQLIEKNSNFVFNFSFSPEESKPVLQRYI